MRFRRFGVTLARLERRDIETVRRWRNSDWVQLGMRRKGHIAPDDQLRWFEGLDSRNDWYFIAEQQGRQCGLFHVKEVDWNERCGEAGGFLGRRELMGGPVPAMAVLALMDFSFFLLGLRSLQAQFDSRLPRVSRFNAWLGYRVFREDPDGFVRASVSAERYLSCADAFRSAAALSHGAAVSLSAPDPWLLERIRASGLVELEADDSLRLLG